MSEEVKTEKTESVKSKRRNTSSKRYKTESCKVISYDPVRKTANVLFKSYGIQVYNVKHCDTAYLNIKYTGDIGKSNFTYGIINEE